MMKLTSRAIHAFSVNYAYFTVSSVNRPEDRTLDLHPPLASWCRRHIDKSVHNSIISPDLSYTKCRACAPSVIEKTFLGTALWCLFLLLLVDLWCLRLDFACTSERAVN